MITQNQLKEAYTYDLDSGFFTRLIRPKGSNARIGVISHVAASGYVILSHGKEKYKVHRLAFLYVNGLMPINEVDHIDGNKSNNKWANLREAVHNDNMFNHGLAKNNSSGYRGVNFAYGKCRAQAQILTIKNTI